MKKSLVYLFIPFAIISFSCENDDSNARVQANLSDSCSYDQRATVDVFDDEPGEIVFLTEQNIYQISGGKNSKERINNPLDPCNLPEEFKKDKLKIIFSGELKEVYEWEDLAGQPFKFTELSAVTED